MPRAVQPHFRRLGLSSAAKRSGRLGCEFPRYAYRLESFRKSDSGWPQCRSRGRGLCGMARWHDRPRVARQHPCEAGEALPVRRSGGRQTEAQPLSSEEIATAWRPFFEVCVEQFGPRRCLFESNFPVQKRWCSYAVFWATLASVSRCGCFCSGEISCSSAVPLHALIRSSHRAVLNRVELEQGATQVGDKYRRQISGERAATATIDRCG